MKYDLAAEIEATKQEFRRRWRQEWQNEYCRDHKLYLIEATLYGGTKKVPDISRAPEPPWGCYMNPEFVGIKWDTGFAVITTGAFSKLTQAQLNKLLGGTPNEKRKNVRHR